MPAIHPGWATDAVTSPRVRTAVVLGEGTVCVGRPATLGHHAAGQPGLPGGAGDGLDGQGRVALVDAGQGVAEADRSSGGDAGRQARDAALAVAARQFPERLQNSEVQIADGDNEPRRIRRRSLSGQPTRITG
jgi:hypothetical protein